MKKNYTIPILIFSIFVTILAVFVFIFFLRVIKNKNQHASAILSTLQEKMQEKENVVAFDQKITEIKLLQDSINGYFVDSNKIDTFVNYLERIGLNFKSEVLVKNIEIPSKTENIIIVKLSVIGSFEGVMNTITFLENIPYQINITQIYLNKEIGQSGKEKISKASKWQADITFNILSIN